jgi:hypothetical protein
LRELVDCPEHDLDKAGDADHDDRRDQDQAADTDGPQPPRSSMRFHWTEAASPPAEPWLPRGTNCRGIANEPLDADPRRIGVVGKRPADRERSEKVIGPREDLAQGPACVSEPRVVALCQEPVSGRPRQIAHLEQDIAEKLERISIDRLLRNVALEAIACPPWPPMTQVFARALEALGHWRSIAMRPRTAGTGLKQGLPYDPMRLTEWPRMPYLNEEVRDWIALELKNLSVEDLAVYAVEAGREGDERRVMVATEVGLLDHRYAPFGSSARYRLAMLLYPWQVLRGVELRADTFRLWAMEHRTRWSFRLHHPHFEVATESPDLGQALCDLARVCAVMAEPFGVPAGRVSSEIPASTRGGPRPAKVSADTERTPRARAAAVGPGPEPTSEGGDGASATAEEGTDAAPEAADQPKVAPEEATPGEATPEAKGE